MRLDRLLVYAAIKVLPSSSEGLASWQDAATASIEDPRRRPVDVSASRVLQAAWRNPLGAVPSGIVNGKEVISQLTSRF